MCAGIDAMECCICVGGCVYAKGWKRVIRFVVYLNFHKTLLGKMGESSNFAVGTSVS